jgi:hypothetical protein
MVVETDAALATAQEAVAAAKEDAAKSAIPSDVKRADVTPEMKQAARDGQKAVSEAEGKLSKLTTQREERIAAKEAVEAHRGDAFSVSRSLRFPLSGLARVESVPMQLLLITPG